MPIDKLERLMWRIRSRNPNQNLILNEELRRCVIYECGFSKPTYMRIREALKALGWIQNWKTRKIRLTGKDIESS